MRIIFILPTNYITVKIVVTKDLSMNQTQIERLKTFGEVTFHSQDAKSEEEWLERCKGYDIICTGMFGFKSKKLYELQNVFCSLPFVGIEYLDKSKLKEKNILVSNSPGCNKEAVAEWVLGMLLMVNRNLLQSCNTKNTSKDTLLKTGKTIHGKKITILGAGNIGKYLGKLCLAFNMDISYYKRGYNLLETIKNADIIVNCLPSNESTKGILNKEFFESLKRGVIFISVARHETYDIKVLKSLLENGSIAIAIDDSADSLVGSIDDPVYKNLLSYPNMYVTPHLAWNSEIEAQKANDMMIDNIEAWSQGNPINIVK